MRVVVIGGTGNVGLALTRALTAEPRVHDVTVVARRHAKALPAGARMVVADVTGADLRPIVAGADAAVHLAWLIQPSRSLDIQWAVNVAGAARMLAAVADEGVPALVVASSVGAYSPRSSLDPVDETWPTHGIASSAYSRQKAYVERMLDDFEARNPTTRVARLRPGLIFQTEAAASQKRYFAGPLLPRLLLRPGVLPVMPHLSGVHFQAVHADDVADAFLRAVLSDVRGAVNVATDQALSTRDVADLLGARPVPVPFALARWWIDVAWRLRLHPLEGGWLDLAARCPILDSTRARAELGWTPRHDGPTALRTVLRGIADGSAGPTPPLAAHPVEVELLDALRTGMGGRSTADPRAHEPDRR
ncbi:MAG TPA: NAD-dependent epimerase/dehydratase family protein [Euzebyales bacterium]|nr:NAD-dependent epimerase/dehydratase family protein [Euzebyales bacterium]